MKNIIILALLASLVAPTFVHAQTVDTSACSIDLSQATDTQLRACLIQLISQLVVLEQMQLALQTAQTPTPTPTTAAEPTSTTPPPLVVYTNPTQQLGVTTPTTTPIVAPSFVGSGFSITETDETANSITLYINKGNLAGDNLSMTVRCDTINSINGNGDLTDCSSFAPQTLDVTNNTVQNPLTITNLLPHSAYRFDVTATNMSGSDTRKSWGDRTQ